jgi:hypothetical protein
VGGPSRGAVLARWVLRMARKRALNGLAFGEVETDLNRCGSVVRWQRLEDGAGFIARQIALTHGFRLCGFGCRLGIVGEQPRRGSQCRLRRE